MRSRLISKLLNRRSWGWVSLMKGATWVMLTWTAMLLGSKLSPSPIIFLNDPKMQVLAFVSSGPTWRPHSARGVKTLTGWGKSSRWLKKNKDKRQIGKEQNTKTNAVPVSKEAFQNSSFDGKVSGIVLKLWFFREFSPYPHLLTPLGRSESVID